VSCGGEADTTSRVEDCSKVTSSHCYGEKVRSHCFACGENVCKACSGRRKWYSYGIVRVCDDCLEGASLAGALTVLRKRYTEVGYSGPPHGEIDRTKALWAGRSWGS
jgi:hypothetical protein